MWPGYKDLGKEELAELHGFATGSTVEQAWSLAYDLQEESKANPNDDTVALLAKLANGLALSLVMHQNRISKQRILDELAEPGSAVLTEAGIQHLESAEIGGVDLHQSHLRKAVKSVFAATHEGRDDETQRSIGRSLALPNIRPVAHLDRNAVTYHLLRYAHAALRFDEHVAEEVQTPLSGYAEGAGYFVDLASHHLGTTSETSQIKAELAEWMLLDVNRTPEKLVRKTLRLLGISNDEIKAMFKEVNL